MRISSFLQVLFTRLNPVRSQLGRTESQRRQRRQWPLTISLDAGITNQESGCTVVDHGRHFAAVDTTAQRLSARVQDLDPASAEASNLRCRAPGWPAFTCVVDDESAGLDFTFDLIGMSQM